MIGLLTRISAFILAGEMAFAYFLGHMLKTGAPVLLPLNNGGTAAILFCFACLYLATAGGGPLSLDAFLRVWMPLEPEARRFGQPDVHGFGQARR